MTRAIADTRTFACSPLQRIAMCGQNIMNTNLSLIDAAVGTYFIVQNLQGPWANSTVYHGWSVCCRYRIICRLSVSSRSTQARRFQRHLKKRVRSILTIGRCVLFSSALSWCMASRYELRAE